jgi:AcrR family transcriptional regulator
MQAAKTSGSAEAPRIGRREANKRDKLVRIRRAAREVFLREGYEDATLREIATAADVAFGTLFLYAKNKQDLLLLLFDEELPALTERAFQKADPAMPFIDQLIAFFTEFYAFFSETPRLSRDMMREITFTGGIV